MIVFKRKKVQIMYRQFLTSTIQNSVHLNIKVILVYIIPLYKIVQKAIYTVRLCKFFIVSILKHFFLSVCFYAQYQLSSTCKVFASRQDGNTTCANTFIRKVIKRSIPLDNNAMVYDNLLLQTQNKLILKKVPICPHLQIFLALNIAKCLDKYNAIIHIHISVYVVYGSNLVL